MALQIRLNNRLLESTEWMGGDGVTITKRRSKESGGIATDISGEWLFKGQAYAEIRAAIWDNPQGNTVRYPVEIIDDCCDDAVIFAGYIDSNSTELCFDSCEISCRFKELSTEADKINCIQSTYIFDNTNGFQQQQHPFTRYCGELRPNWLMDLFMIVGLVVEFMLLLLFPLILVISLFIISYNAVVKIVCLFVQSCIDKYSITDQGNDGIIDWWREVMDYWEGIISGCFRGHPSPLVRSYILNACQICGLSFRSTILNQATIQGNESWNPQGLNIGQVNPYYNTMLLYAPVRDGEHDYTTWIDDNKPLYTLDKFLEELKKTWNADFKIIGNELVFERRDAFIQSIPWVDLSDPISNPNKILELCFQASSDKQPAWARFQVMQDGLDWVGNEAKDRYNEIASWNDPYNPNLVGEKIYYPSHTSARFRTDGIELDALDRWRGFFSAIGADSFFVDEDYDYSLLLGADMTLQFKLLIWDEANSGYENAKTVKFPAPFDPSLYIFNNDLTFSAPGNIVSANVSPKDYLPGNLFDRFFYIENPNLNPLLNRSYKAKIARSCADISMLSFDKSVILPAVFGQQRLGSIEEVVITQSTLEIKGKF